MEKLKKKIKNKIETLWTEFKENENDWCDLNTSLNIKSYSAVYNQQYYLIKYFPAYFTEYFHIWKTFFKEYKKQSIKIISIGCGVGIDFIALKEYKRLHKTPKFDYKGIDLISWKNKFKSMPFIQKDIEEIDTDDLNNIDLIVFPKILTELTSDNLKKLASKIIQSNTSSELYFINSYITNDSSKQNVDGIDQFKIICDDLKQNGFTTDDLCNEYTYFKKQQGLIVDYSFCVYPNEVKDSLINLKSNCTNYNEEENDCKDCNIGTSPILYNKYIAYNIFKFVKK